MSPAEILPRSGSPAEILGWLTPLASYFAIAQKTHRTFDRDFLDGAVIPLLTRQKVKSGILTVAKAEF